MTIRSLMVGEIGTNCYILMDDATKKAAVIDPGDNAAKILKVVQELGAFVECILLTHGHYDHTTGVEGLLNVLNVPVYIHQGDVGVGMLNFTPQGDTRYYGEGDQITLGELTVDVMHTPGHSKGSVCLKTGDVLFTGDTLFRGSCGRTDFPGGSLSEILKSLGRLDRLSGDYRVLPGHEGESTLERERKSNYYMLQARKA